MKPTSIQKTREAGKNFALGAVLALMLAGCATPPPPMKGSPDLLSFMADGKTTKAEVIATLGQAAGRFEGEKILTYRLGFEPRNNGYYLVERESRKSGWPVWSKAAFSLVLVFDDASVLQQHSLVKVNR